MRAVMSCVPPDILALRKRTGAERWDEMWDGVLHMTPSPNREHQGLEGAMERWLWTHWAEPNGNQVYHQINVASIGGWSKDYRIPDLVLLTPDRFCIDHNEYFEGPPTVAVEIHSPGDEAYEKLDFYADLGVPEVWIIDRDAKIPSIYLLRDGRYAELAPAADGWLHSPATGVRLRVEAGPRLGIQMADDASTQRLLPQR
jgi:Uma2 family endonuclease